jgi:hypothetical protein
MASDPSKSSSGDQSHPLYATDRDVVDRLLAAEVPADANLVDAARLLMRYEAFPGARDLSSDLAKALRLWGMSRDDLHSRTQAIWARGYRPAPAASEAVGSSFDTADQEQS